MLQHMRTTYLLGLSVAVCTAFSSSVHAQSIGASESGVIVASGVMATAGFGLSGSGGEWTGSGGQPLAGEEASSDNYIVRSGVVWTPATVGTSQPMVFGVRPGGGAKGGGNNATVFGYNFSAPGAGFPFVEFVDGVGAGTAVVGNTELTTTVPAGISALGNPLAISNISLSNNHGDDDEPGVYNYLPALLQATPHAILGGPLKLRTIGTPGGFYTIVFGGTIPNTGFPVAPYDGQLEILLNVNFLIGFASLPATGIHTLPLTLPDDPSLSGLSVKFQALAFNDLSLATGSFSNLLTVDLL